MSMTAALTTADLIRAVETLPRYPLAHLPTPLEFLPRFSKALGGPPIYIKRDDCTGLAIGGNKTRHNEFLIGAALQQQADVVVWGAGVQSNNCRQTAAACAKAGLDCHLVLGRAKPSAAPDPVQGNLLLDHLVGAIIDIVDEPLGPGLHERISAKAAEYAAQGRRPYAWDEQTVKPLAAVSYVLCMVEIVQQSAQLGIQPQAVYVSSAGSTGAGLALAQVALGVEAPVRNIAGPGTVAFMGDIRRRTSGLDTRARAWFNAWFQAGNDMRSNALPGKAFDFFQMDSILARSE